jgi:hypothetical protein
VEDAGGISRGEDLSHGQQDLAWQALSKLMLNSGFRRMGTEKGGGRQGCFAATGVQDLGCIYVSKNDINYSQESVVAEEGWSCIALFAKATCGQSVGIVHAELE